MARTTAKRYNSSGDPTSRPKITPVSPKRKQARCLPPTSSVHDEPNVTARPTSADDDATEATPPTESAPPPTPSGGCSSSSEEGSPVAGGGSIGREGEDATTPPSSPSPIKRRTPQRRVEAVPLLLALDSGGGCDGGTTASAEVCRADSAPSPPPSTTILSLPNELILQISEKLFERDLNSFSRANSRLYRVLTHALYRMGKEIEFLDNSTILHWAASRGLTQTVLHLLTQGANPNSKFQRAPHPFQSDGRTPLHIAAELGHGRIARLLLDAGAVTKVWDRDGNTPLHLAVRHGMKGTVKILLSVGAKITARNAEGLRPLHTAVLWERREIVKLLLSRGADLAATDRTGGTALHLAASFWSPGMCALLLDHNRGEPEGCNRGRDMVNTRDLAGMTPLHWAAYTGWEPVVRLLVTRGADVMGRDVEGRSPLHYAGDGGNKEAFEYLTKVVKVEELEGPLPVLRKERMPLTAGMGVVAASGAADADAGATAAAAAG